MPILFNPFISPAAVAANTAHVAGDGSDHADVASNSTARHTQGTDQKLDEGGGNEVSVANVADAVSKKHSQNTDTQLGTIAANINMNGYEIQGAGVIEGGVTIITNTGDVSLNVGQCKTSVVFQTNTGTITLPAVSGVIEGANVTVYSQAAAAVHIDVDDNDRITLDGTALTVGHKISSASAAGDQITLVKDSADGWTTIGRSGTWTDGS